MLDLIQDPPLRAGQVIRQAVEEPVGELPARLVGDADRALHLVALLHGQGQLETEELFVHQPLPGRRHVLDLLGEVDRLEGLVAFHEPVGRLQLGGKGVVDGPGARQGVVNGATQMPGADATRGRVHGDDAPHREPLGVSRQHVHRRGLHLEGAPEALHHTGQGDLVGVLEKLDQVSLVEPDRLDAGAVVLDDGLDDLEIATGPPMLDGHHLPDDRHLRPDGHPGDRLLPRSVYVPPRHMVEQVGDGLDPGFGEFLGPFAAETFDLPDVDGGETG